MIYRRNIRLLTVKSKGIEVTIMILEQIVEKRKEQLAREIEKAPRVEIERAARFANMPVRNFEAALRKDRLSVIAEVKKASPSKGLIKQECRRL
jgi:indole-3-glycerol phosphate synthase